MADTSIENRGPELLGVNITFIALAFVAAVLRIYVRLGLVKAFGVDDWFMSFATVFFVAYISCSITGVHYGTGRHFDDLPSEGIKKAMMYWWFCYLFYCLAMISSKISIGVFLLRIATNKLHRWITYIAMMLTVVTGIVFFFVTMFQCKPISYFWDQDQDGKCINVGVVIGLAYLYSVFSVISDFTFALLPVFLISQLHMERKAKLVLSPLLAMGCVASCAVVARFPYLKDLKNPDFLYATLDIAIWSSVEQGLAITAGSLATLRPLVKRLGIRLKFSRSPSGYRTSGKRGVGSGYIISGGRARTPIQPSGFTLGLSKLPKSGNDSSDQDVESGPKPIPPPKDTKVSGHIWKTTEVRINESEEELQRDVSKEAFEESLSVVPQSFLGLHNYKSQGRQ